MKFKYSVKTIGLARVGLNVLEKPQEALEAVARAGYHGIEVKGEPDKISPTLANEIGRVAKSFEISLPTVGGAWGAWDAKEERDLGASDEAIRKHALGYAQRCIDLCVNLGSPIFEICGAPFRCEYPYSSVPLATTRRNFVTSVKEICKYAAERGVAIAIEPINRFEGYQGFLNSVADTVDVIREVGAENLGVLVDLFHANIEDPSVAHAIRTAGKRLMNIHLSDSDRDEPGRGHIDFVEVVTVLDEVGYRGFMAMGFLPPRMDLKTLRKSLLENCVPYMREQERLASSRKAVSAVN